MPPSDGAVRFGSSLTLTSVSFLPTWRHDRRVPGPGGQLTQLVEPTIIVVRGVSSSPTRVFLPPLEAAPGFTSRYRFIAPLQPAIDVGGGPFEARLDARVFSARQAHASPEPGPYVAQITDLTDLNNKSNRVIAILRGPPEGAIVASKISRTSSGPAVRSFRRGTQRIWATFVFATYGPPRTGPIRAYWYSPRGTFLAAVRKPAKRVVQSVVYARGALSPGRWKCQLRVGHTVVGTLSSEIGSTTR